MNSLDRKICEEVADLWLSNGGDAEGFLFCWNDVYRILKDREAESHNYNTLKDYQTNHPDLQSGNEQIV